LASRQHRDFRRQRILDAKPELCTPLTSERESVFGKPEPVKLLPRLPWSADRLILASSGNHFAINLADGKVSVEGRLGKFLAFGTVVTNHGVYVAAWKEKSMHWNRFLLAASLIAWIFY